MVSLRVDGLVNRSSKRGPRLQFDRMLLARLRAVNICEVWRGGKAVFLFACCRVLLLTLAVNRGPCNRSDGKVSVT